MLHCFLKKDFVMKGGVFVFVIHSVVEIVMGIIMMGIVKISFQLEVLAGARLVVVQNIVVKFAKADRVQLNIRFFKH